MLAFQGEQTEQNEKIHHHWHLLSVRLSTGPLARAGYLWGGAATAAATATSTASAAAVAGGAGAGSPDTHKPWSSQSHQQAATQQARAYPQELIARVLRERVAPDAKRAALACVYFPDARTAAADEEGDEGAGGGSSGDAGGAEGDGGKCGIGGVCGESEARSTQEGQVLHAHWPQLPSVLNGSQRLRRSMCSSSSAAVSAADAACPAENQDATAVYWTLIVDPERQAVACVSPLHSLTIIFGPCTSFFARAWSDVHACQASKALRPMLKCPPPCFSKLTSLHLFAALACIHVGLTDAQAGVISAAADPAFWLPFTICCAHNPWLEISLVVQWGLLALALRCLAAQDTVLR
eukprot:1148458-Pelagomonas_calceolata.AAC.6